jgi:lysozyme family protein
MPTYIEVFEAAHAHVAKWEGGFFDHPADPGGVTNHGVSLMFLKSLGLLEGDVNGDGEISRADILAITKDNAKLIFKRHFWDKPGVEHLPPLIAVAFYDLAVNAGCGRAAIVLQEGVNAAKGNRVISAHAPNLGPLTRTYAAEFAASGRQLALANAYLDAREAWYRRLATAKTTSAVFLKGWLNRTNACRDLLHKLATEWRLT